jgi:hypothetical protein
MDKKKDTVEIVADVIDGNGHVPSDDLITLSSGVVLRGKSAPPLILIKVMARFPRPPVPMYFNKTMGREMENPEDPDYLARVADQQTQSSNAMLNALISLGTELVSVPRKFPKPEDDSWLDEWSEIGLEARPGSPTWRYITWVTFKAVLSKEDLDLIQKVVGRLSGVPESAVRSAEEFPGRDETDR